MPSPSPLLHKSGNCGNGSDSWDARASGHQIHSPKYFSQKVIQKNFTNAVSYVFMLSVHVVILEALP